MKRDLVIIIATIISVICLALLGINLLRLPNRTVNLELNNIALCYHGITGNESEKSQYVTYIEDFIGQMNYIKSKGYSFVLPSQYNKWYTNKYKPSTPIVTVMFDDARDSISLATDWLIKNDIPFGIAVIGSRLHSIESEEGYLNWSALNTMINSGYCELLNHTYNMHHFGLYLENDSVVSAPIMEGPCYLDHGDFLYMDADDTRWYWDLSYVDEISWAFPLLGSDIITGKPITSTVEFKAKENITATKIRVWACLHSPVSSGYAANVKIDINGIEVANKAINIAEYKNRFQWTEREFITIDFDQAYSIEADKTYTIRFTTENSGDSTLLIYSTPDFSGDYQLSSTCTEMTYGAGEKWPAKACLIIADDDGKQISELEYQEYVLGDLTMNNKVISNYLAAAWTANTTGYTENDNLECIVLGGMSSDGELGNTTIKFIPENTFTGQALRVKYASHLGEWYPLIIDIYINDSKVARYSPNWEDLSWQTVDISPYEFINGKEYSITFKTVNKSSRGTGMIRILTDQQDPPWPKWNFLSGKWIKPSDLLFQHGTSYEVSFLEGSDIYPDDIHIDYSEYSWKYSAPYNGPGKPLLEVLSFEVGSVAVPTQICYPFGSYYVQNKNGIEDINPVLKSVLESISIETGYAIWGEGNSSMENIRSQYSSYIIPRYMVEGNIEQSQILKNIDILIGSE